LRVAARRERSQRGSQRDANKSPSVEQRHDS
jgi:hypothetical protein